MLMKFYEQMQGFSPADMKLMINSMERVTRSAVQHIARKVKQFILDRQDEMCELS